MSTDKRLLVFANPISGAGRGARLAQGLLAALGARGYEARLFLCPACEVAPQTLREPWQAAIVIGGDGTLLSVAQHLLAQLEDEQIPPILTVPLGTANLMARHLRCKWHLSRIGEEVPRMLEHPRLREVDVSTASGRPFLLVAGVGFDAGVVHALAASRRGPIAYTSYIAPTLGTLKNYRFQPLTIDADGSRLIENMPAIAFIGNVPEYGAGFSVTPLAKSDDGLLDLCILPCRDWRDLMELGMICGSQLHTAHERAIYRRVKSLHIESPAKIPVEVDGEAAGFTPLDVAVTGRRLRFIECG